MNSDGAWRPVTFPSLEAALSRNLVLQSVYFALGKREDEVAQLKCWVVLERTDEGALRLSMRRTKMTNTKAAIKQATATRRMKSSWITWR
jgi:hypothetical protein